MYSCMDSLSKITAFPTFFRYTGYIPQQRYGYGDTFGTITTELFHKHRDCQLQKTKTHSAAGKNAFPTVYSNNPASVLGNRKRCRERWLANQKYSRTLEGTKEDEMNNFLQVRFNPIPNKEN